MTTASPAPAPAAPVPPAAGPTPTVATSRASTQDELREASQRRVDAALAVSNNEAIITSNEALIPGLDGDISAAQLIIDAKGPDVAKKRQDLEALRQRIAAHRTVAEAARTALREANGEVKKVQKSLSAIEVRKREIEAKEATLKAALDAANAAHGDANAAFTAAKDAATPDASEVARTKALLKQKAKLQRKAQGDYNRIQTKLEAVNRDDAAKRIVEAEKITVRDALVEPDAEARKEGDRLLRQRRKEQSEHDKEAAELLAQEQKKAGLAQRLAAVRQAIVDAEAQRDTLNAAAASAEEDTNRLIDQLSQEQQAAAAITPVTEGLGARGNFTKDEQDAIIKIFEKNLKTTEAWGADFTYDNPAPTAQQIVFHNGKTGNDLQSVTINPTLISIDGKMDDKAIQAALLAADLLWKDRGGIQIKTRWGERKLKRRIVANAEFLKQRGLINSYKANTLFGPIGEGFDKAKQQVVAPSQSWIFGKNPLATHKHVAECIANGFDSRITRGERKNKLKDRKMSLRQAAPAAATP